MVSDSLEKGYNTEMKKSCSKGELKGHATAPTNFGKANLKLSATK